MFWKAMVAVQADADSFLVVLQKAVAGYKSDPEWPAMLKAQDQEKDATNK